MGTPEQTILLIGGLAALAIVAIVALSVASSTPAFKQICLGVIADPLVTGTMRALLVYLLPLTIGAAIAYLGGVSDPRWLPLVPIAVGAIRVLEARADGWLKPGQNSVNPPAVAGGGDKDLLE